MSYDRRLSSNLHRIFNSHSRGMKLYVHFEGEQPCTLICRIQEADPLESLLKGFLQRYANKFGKMLSVDNLQLQTTHSTVLPLKKRTGKVLKELDDVFVVDAAKPSQPIAPSTPVAAEKSTVKVKEEEKPVAKPVEPVDPSMLAHMMVRGEHEEKEDCFRKAVEHYEWVLARSPHHRRALVALMSLWTKVGRPQVAKEYCKLAMKHHPEDLAVLVASGKLKQACKDYEPAVEIFNKAITIAKQKSKAAFPVEDIEIHAANAMYSLGGAWENPAVQLVMSVVEPERTHFEGLLLYAKIAFHRGLIEDAIRVFLRLIMQKQEQEEVKRYLADCFEKSETMHFVVGELKSGSGVGSAYAFLAARIKDYGAVDAAVQLYQKALETDATDPSIALNYVHTLELVSRTDDIITFCKKFLLACKVDLIRSVKAKEIGQLLDGLASIKNTKEDGWLRMEAWKPHSKCESIEDNIEKVTFNEVQLDLLALLFTVVKVLFVGGALERAFQIVQLVRLCTEASEVKLHTTTVRNEAAYFNCIRQILEDYPLPEISSDANVQALYLCGDSHCLSAAWKRMRLKGEDYILVPKLVTGCKVWHLRSDSRFYPKCGFDRTVKSLPRRSSIVLSFGEIDCRTGIGLAVEKCKEAAIEKTVSIYIQVIKELIREKDFVIYVHPVPPALDVTRPMVLAYNRVLKNAILTAAGQKLCKGRLFWLDFLEDLLTPDRTSLKPEMVFDNTHLAPVYAQYLQAALLKCEEASE